MKVIYFTFLVLFLFVCQSFADCFSSCGCANGSCPNDSAFLCFTSCKKANSQPTAQSNSTSSAPAKSTTKSKSTSSKSSSKNSNSANDNSSQQSTSAESCGPDYYPNEFGGGCLKCPGNSSKFVGGKGYCNIDSSVSNDPIEAERAKCALENGEWNENNTPKCLSYELAENKNKCLAEGKSWSSEKLICESATASNTDSYNCIERFNQMMDQCKSEASSAMTSCNDNNDEMQAAENTAKLIGAGSVASMQVACSKIGELSKLANGAFTGFKALCSANQGGCTESCTEAKRLLDIECIEQAPKEALKSTFYKQITDNINQCESYKTKIAQATQHAAAALAQLKASEQCKNDTSSLVNNAVDQCKANPNSPLCKDLQKCSDANFAAQNPVCACASNPTSPSCLQASANYGSGAKSTGATLPGVNGGKDTSGLPGLNGTGNGDGQNTGLGANAVPATDGHGVGGRQGDASSAGNLKNNAAGGPAGGNHNGAGGAGKDPLKVNSGTLGGVPGGPGYFGRSPTSGGNFTNNAINGNKGTLGKFDPRKYITGLGGKGEYINGANQNIFMIVKMRYEDKKTSLLPETFNLKK